MEERFTIAGVLRHFVGEHPDAEMFVCGDQRRTWRDQYERAGQVAHALEAEGVGPGDRVALLDRNGLPYFDTVFGGSLIGAVNVAVNWRLAAPEMADVIDDSEATVLVVHADYLHTLGGMESGLPHVRRIVVCGDPSEDDHADKGGASDSGRRVDLEAWLKGQPTDDPGYKGSEDDVSIQLYTSGTTGLPKGVMLSNGNLSTALGQAATTFNIDEDTVSLIAMPLFHIGGSGWALCGMSRGGRSVILRDVDPVELLRLVETEHVTDSFLVPAVLMFLLMTPQIADTDLSSLRTIFYGASPISEDVLEKCIETFGCEFTQVYGLTETTGAITALRAEDHDPSGPRRHLLRSAGKPHEVVELRIVSPETGEDAEVGEVGEITTRSPYNMLGYFGKPEETAKTLTDDGWLRTGDAGYLDEHGYLFLHDRMKDMVVTGGENVYPAEVENALLGHPAVADAAVIGVPDDKWGEAVKAVVVLAKDQSATAEDLIAYSKERLAGYKCPKSVDFADELPRNPTGKILKRELREPYWKGRHRQIG